MKKVIDWDTYFMALAHMSALRSKDPNTTVGAVIVETCTELFLSAIMACLEELMRLLSLGKEKATS